MFGAEWARNLHFVIPVWDLAFWTRPEVTSGLIEVLQFLTGDEFSFQFTQRATGTPLQRFLQFRELAEAPFGADLIVLFSGGVDSLAAAIEAVQNGRKPMLVSHRSAPTIDRRQRELVGLLRRSFGASLFPHVSLWVNRSGGRRPSEFTQRSRAFLFTTMGVVAASQLNLSEVRLCDNGVVSINLPQSGQGVGTFLSRSTHPRFLQLAEAWMRIVTERPDLSIRNTLLFKTRKEVMEDIARARHPELIQESVSCAHPGGRTRLQPHCGVCSQCVDRKFASTASGLEAFDLPERYERDIFTDPLKRGCGKDVCRELHPVCHQG